MLSDVLAHSQLFSTLEPHQREIVAAGGVRRSAATGSLLITGGTTNHSLLVILTGAVRVERPGESGSIELARLGPGAVLGEMSFVDGGKTSADVVAAEPTEILELPFKMLEQTLREHPDLGVRLWRSVAVELKDRLEKTNNLVKNYVDEDQVRNDNDAYADFIKCWC